MPKRFLVKIGVPPDASESEKTRIQNSLSGSDGLLTALINADSVRREGESTSDTPNAPETSSIRVDTRTQVEETWDVPDATILAGVSENQADIPKTQVGIQFNQDVRLPDGRGLELAHEEWLRVQGIEIPNSAITIIPVTDSNAERYALRATYPTMRLGNDATFTITVRTRFNAELDPDPTSLPSALILSRSAIATSPPPATVVCKQSYSFTCTTPSNGAGVIAITAVAAQWSVLTANQELGKVIYGSSDAGAPTATIGSGSLSGATLTFDVSWSYFVGSDFTPTAISFTSSNSSMSAAVASLTDQSGGTQGEDFTVTATVTGTGRTTFTAVIAAGAIPLQGGTPASARTTQALGSVVRRASGVSPTLGNPINAGLVGGRIRNSTFQIPVTWPAAAASQASTAFTAADVSANFTDASPVAGQDHNGPATIGTPVRVGSTNVWNVPITFPIGSTPENRMGDVTVVVRGGALPQTDAREASGRATRTYPARLRRSRS